jgi:hypothetical protein
LVLIRHNQRRKDVIEQTINVGVQLRQRDWIPVAGVDNQTQLLWVIWLRYEAADVNVLKFMNTIGGGMIMGVRRASDVRRGDEEHGKDCHSGQIQNTREAMVSGHTLSVLSKVVASKQVFYNVQKFFEHPV